MESIHDFIPWGFTVLSKDANGGGKRGWGKISWLFFPFPPTTVSPIAAKGQGQKSKGRLPEIKAAGEQSNRDNLLSANGFSLFKAAVSENERQLIGKEACGFV
jgi:hypothetical protein